LVQHDSTRLPLRNDPFVAFVDAAPILMWLADADGWRTFFNLPWLDFTGRTLADEIGDGWQAGVHEDDRRAYRTAFETFRTGDPFQIEYRLRRSDGAFCNMVDRIAPRLDADGCRTGFIGCCVETTAHVNALAALQESETRFRLLAENAGDMIYRYRVQPTYGTEYISRAVTAITGRTPQEFAEDAELPGAAMHPDDRPLAEEMRRSPAQFPEPTVIRWIHREGHVVYVEHRNTPIHDAEGRLVALEGIGRDVSERMAAQERLAESETRFRLLAENASDLIYRYAIAPLRCEYISPAATTITGYSPQDFYADRLLPEKALHPEDRWLLTAGQLHPETLRDPFLVRWCHPDGRIVAVEHRNTPVYTDTGRLIAIEGIGRDVTETLAIHDRLRRSETHLRRLTASLHKARETERAHVARELHDELGQTLTSLKLDLTRTVRDLLPLQLAPAMIDRMQSMVGGIEVATESVRRLATALRPPALDHLGLGAAIELEASAVARRTGLRCRISGTLRTAGLGVDKTTAVFRIVQEALTNIVRHADASAIRLTMRQTEDQFTVKIQDNGRGITPAQLTNPSSIGVLGMQERAELIGAQLTISTKPGKGTAIVIVAPLSREPDAAAT
jgi:PAS domain S-box-containing protein